uniref:Laminin N-terminal domain-containing protein n=1 Tax=Ascaris lumbricoides TaxID=6252 RepID=A0A0M3IS04_ASCLU
MEPKALLLLNATIIIVISISTDYWIKISYLVDRVPKGCRLTNYVEYSTIECANERRILTDQHSNLFRQCNDLTGYYFRNNNNNNNDIIYN